MHAPNSIPADLTRARNLSLTSFRRDGTPVATPVWFAAVDCRLYVTTTAESYKVRRLRRDPRAAVAACARLGKTTGPEHEATVRVLDLSEAPEIQAAVTNRYGVQHRLFQWMNRRRGDEMVLLEITLSENPSDRRVETPEAA